MLEEFDWPKNLSSMSEKQKDELYIEYVKHMKTVERDTCDSNPSVLYDPDLMLKTGFNPKKINSATSHKEKSDSLSYLVSDGDDDEPISYNQTLVSGISYVVDFEKTTFKEEKPKVRVLSPEEEAEIKERERLDQLSDAERDAEERFGVLA